MLSNNYNLKHTVHFQTQPPAIDCPQVEKGLTALNNEITRDHLSDCTVNKLGKYSFKSLIGV